VFKNLDVTKLFTNHGRCLKSQQVQSVECSNVGKGQLSLSNITNHQRCTFCPQIVNLLSDNAYANIVVVFRFLIVVSISNHNRCTFCPQIVNMLSDNAYAYIVVVFRFPQTGAAELDHRKVEKNFLQG
jgi:hypothetical protein